MWSLDAQKARLLFSSCDGVDEVVEQNTDSLPDFDYQCAVMDLAQWFVSDLNTIPADVPYMKSDDELIGKWSKELRSQDRYHVGIAWQGSPGYRWDRWRSFPLECFEPLSKIKGVRLYSLQKGFGSEQVSCQRFPWSI